MGNLEIREAYKSFKKGSDGNNIDKLGLTCEVLFEDSMIQNILQYVEGQMGVSIPDYNTTFPNHNIQKNSALTNNDKEARQLDDFNMNYMLGLTDAELTLENGKKLAEQIVLEQHLPTRDFTDIQRYKFMLLYAMFAEHHKASASKSTNFFTFLNTQLKKSVLDPSVQLGLDSTFKFSL